MKILCKNSCVFENKHFSFFFHNTTNKAARGEVSLHLIASACPSPIEEGEWGSLLGAVSLRQKPALSTAVSSFLRRIIQCRGFLVLLLPEKSKITQRITERH